MEEKVQGRGGSEGEVNEDSTYLSPRELCEAGKCFWTIPKSSWPAYVRANQETWVSRFLSQTDPSAEEVSQAIFSITNFPVRFLQMGGVRGGKGSGKSARCLISRFNKPTEMHEGNDLRRGRKKKNRNEDSQ